MHVLQHPSSISDLSGLGIVLYEIIAWLTPRSAMEYLKPNLELTYISHLSPNSLDISHWWCFWVAT
jgi:hypothetical protein